MPDHQRAVVVKLCEVGRLYEEVREFTEKRAGETSYGLVGHSFVTAINFISSVCGETKAISAGLLSRLESMDPATLYLGELDSPFLEVVGEAWRAASKHVLDVMCDKFHLLAHLAALRKILLLGQGDIMRYLLDLLDGELGQPATQLMPHNLAGILETAIRGTNTQYEDPAILGRLDVKLLEIQPGDTGWDVFSLDYKVTGPIGVVFTQDAMTQYLMLFNTLWRAKRMEWVLSGVICIFIIRIC